MIIFLKHNQNTFSEFLKILFTYASQSEAICLMPSWQSYSHQARAVTQSSNTLQWRHNKRNGISNHQRLNCLVTHCSGTDQRKHQSPTSLVFVRGIHRWWVASPNNGPVPRKRFPFDDVIMRTHQRLWHSLATELTWGWVFFFCCPPFFRFSRDSWTALKLRSERSVFVWLGLFIWEIQQKKTTFASFK